MARKFLFAGLLCALLGPGLAYEGLQKAHEHLGAQARIARLAALAEARTPWRPSTGSALLDHPVHELQEARLFWALATRRLARA